VKNDVKYAVKIDVKYAAEVRGERDGVKQCGKSGTATAVSTSGNAR
jgi:hypothetical protein